jgi:hypothetical protein
LPAGAQAANHGFIPNAGQWSEEVRFALRSGGSSVRVDDHGWWVAGRNSERGQCLRFVFEGPGIRPRAVPSEVVQQGRVHFLLGRDAEHWTRDLRAAGAVRFAGVAPGVDFVLRGDGEGLAYDLELGPGADLDRVRITCEGARGLRVLEDGALQIETASGPLRQTPPVAWQIARDTGARVPLRARFRLLSAECYGFEAPQRDPSLATVIDPDLIWSTFVGESGDCRVLSARALPNGRVLVAGATDSFCFPTTPGAFDPFANGSLDGFVSLLEADGSTLVWSTYLGGSGADEIKAMAVDSAGMVTVAGGTASTDFPTTPGAFDPNPNGFLDGFVARISAAGDTLVWSTYLGGSANDRCNAVALGPGGIVAAGGTSLSADFPTTPGAFSPFFNGGQFSGDGFVTQLDPGGSSLVFSTYLGGFGEDGVVGMEVGPSGPTTVLGITSSSNFPTTPGAFASQFSGAFDMFVTRLDTSGGSLAASTYLGGAGNEEAVGLALGAGGDVVVVGSTDAAGYPVTGGSFDLLFAGTSEGVVTRLAADLSSPIFSTYLGGNGDERVTAVVIEPSGTIVVAGSTDSKDFATTPGAYDRTFNESLPPLGFDDAFVARMQPDGKTLDYSTYFGSDNNDEVLALAVHPGGGVVLAGRTSSFFFPTTAGALNGFYGFTAVGLGFTSLLDLLVRPIPYGQGKLSSAGVAGVIGYNGFPSVADQDLELNVIALGLGFQRGVFLRGSAPANLPFKGAVLWVAPPLRRVGSFTMDFIGFASLPVQLDPGMIGATLYFQAWYTDPFDPLKFGLSDGLAVLVHP